MAQPRSSVERRSQKLNSNSKRVLLINCLLFALCIVVFIRQSGSARAGFDTLKHVETAPLLIAGGLYIGSLIAASTSYIALGWPKLRFGPTLLTQVAAGFVNRLLPAGLGGLGIFAVYIQRCGYKLTEASAIVATNNLLGFVGTALLVVGMFLSGVRPDWRLPTLRPSYLVVAALLIALGVVIVSVTIGRRHFRHVKSTARSFVVSLLGLLRPRPRSLIALLANLSLTALLAVVLSCCVLAVQGSPSWTDALFVMTIGTAVGAATPTPGGVGGVEAGLVAGLIASGVPAKLALPAVLVYRLLTYWLPLIPGIIAFRMFETTRR